MNRQDVRNGSIYLTNVLDSESLSNTHTDFRQAMHWAVRSPVSPWDSSIHPAQFNRSDIVTTNQQSDAVHIQKQLVVGNTNATDLLL